MTIQPIHIYGLIVLQHLSVVVRHIAGSLIALSLISILICCMGIFIRGSDEDKYFTFFRTWLPRAIGLLPIAILLGTVTVFVPSWKDLALIYGVPPAINGSEVVLHDIGEQYPKLKQLIESKLDESLGAEEHKK